MAIERVIGSVTSTMGGLGELLTRHPFPDADPLISTLDRTVTAGEARLGASTVAAQLHTAGLEPGQAVVAQLPNGPEYILAMFGAWLAGGVFVPANVRQPQAELDHVVSSTAPAAVIDSEGIRAVDAEASRYGPDIAFVTWNCWTGCSGRCAGGPQTRPGPHRQISCPCRWPSTRASTTFCLDYAPARRW